MAASCSSLLLHLLFIATLWGFITIIEGATTTTWCVARSDASTQALQTALDYACASGADCVPVQSDGFCYLPNTIQAHASYAYNSYYQKRAMAPGSCDFSGTATIAQTDPSYGSCVYPSSVSTAGGTGTTPTSTANPTPTTTIPNAPPTATTTNPTFGNGVVGGGLTPVTTPALPNDSKAASLESMLLTFLIPISFVVYLFY